MSKAKDLLEATGEDAQEVKNAKEFDTGKKWAEILGLKKNKEGRYNTSWGTKTALGIYLVIKRLVKEDEEGK